MLFPYAIHKGQPTELLSAHVMDQGSVINLRSPPKIAADESIRQPERVDDKGFLEEPFRTLHKHEERVIARKILGLAVLHSVPPGPIHPRVAPLFRADLDVGEL